MGLATIIITPMRDAAERIKPPRALYTNFPLGLTLGKPGNADFQHKVLRAAFNLLEETQGPVISDFPITISSTVSEPLVCSLPPRVNSELHPAIDEAQALKAAYERARNKNKRTSVGMKISPDDIPEALARFAKIADGDHWDEVGFPDNSMHGTVHDIRAYYEELACELAEGPIGPWATERWFYDETEAGRLILNARRAMRDKNAPHPIWFYLAPGARQ